MASIDDLRPIKISGHTTKLISQILICCLLALPAFSQETDNENEPISTAENLSSSSKSSEAALYPSRDARNKSLFASATKDEARWLETEYGQILALYRPTEAKQTHGALVLFHAAEDPQVWPPELENLRANLPRYGWETLAISLPQKYRITPPERTASSTSASISSSDDIDGNETEDLNTQPPTIPEASSASSSTSSSANSSSIPREVLTTAYVNAAFDFLKTNTQYNIVVLADNSSVYPILQHLNPQIKENNEDPATVDGPLQALIITNLQAQEPLTKTELEGVFNTEQLPILDIFFAPDSTEQTTSRELHRAVAMRNKIIDYQQLLINKPPTSITQDHQSYLLGRVRGFMKQKASGSELTSSNDTTTGAAQ